MYIQNEWTIETLILAYEETGLTFDINDGLITGIRFEGGEGNV